MRGRKILIGLAGMLVLYLIITTLSICIYANKDEKCHADIAIVLGAGITSEGVSAVFRERLNHAMWLYENEFVEGIIVTGGVGEGNVRSDASVAMEYLVGQGVPEEVIYLEETSTITQENIANAKVIMEENELDTAIIVSDPLHMKRAMLMVKDYGIEGYSSPTPTTMYRSLKTKIPFLCREEFFYVGYRVYRLFN